MLRQSFALVLGLGLLAGAVSHAEAAKRMRGHHLKITGCAYHTPVACTIINTGKAVYALYDASPSIPNATAVSLVGDKIGDVSLCFGIPVKVLKWHQIKLHCPPR